MKSRASRYGAAGVGLALGAPTGWLAIRLLVGDGGWRSELSANPGLYLYMLVATAVVFAAFGVVTGRLSDSLERMNQTLSSMALTDALTGMRNARYFHERLREEHARAVRLGEPLALIVGDLDHFKRVNDRYGHVTGDKLLAAVGRVIHRMVRAGDSACRIGGEEFAVLCPSTDLMEAMQIAERIRAAVAAEAVALAEGSLSITMSLGVARLRPDQDPGAFFTTADGAMYQSKRSGRNRVTANAPEAPVVSAMDDISTMKRSLALEDSALPLLGDAWVGALFESAIRARLERQP